MKKFNVNFWLGIASALFAFVGMILLIVSYSTAGYPLPNNVTATILASGAVLLLAASTVVSVKMGSQHFISALLRVAAIVFVMMVLLIVVRSRVGLVSTIVSWDSGNQTAWMVFYRTVACGVMLLITVIITIVSAFMENHKTEAKV